MRPKYTPDTVLYMIPGRWWEEETPDNSIDKMCVISESAATTRL